MNKQLGRMSILSVEPVLVMFLFSGVPHFVDVYYTFCSEPMHNLPSKINRLLERYLGNMLNDVNRDFDAVMTATRERRSPKSL